MLSGMLRRLAPDAESEGIMTSILNTDCICNFLSRISIRRVAAKNTRFCEDYNLGMPFFFVIDLDDFYLHEYLHRCCSLSKD